MLLTLAVFQVGQEKTIWCRACERHAEVGEWVLGDPDAPSLCFHAYDVLAAFRASDFDPAADRRETIDGIVGILRAAGEATPD